MAYSVRCPIFRTTNCMEEMLASAISGMKNLSRGPISRDVCCPEKWSVEKSEMTAIQINGGNQNFIQCLIAVDMFRDSSGAIQSGPSPVDLL